MKTSIILLTSTLFLAAHGSQAPTPSPETPPVNPVGPGVPVEEDDMDTPDPT